MSCGILTRGSHPKDDLLPCGTPLYWGVGKQERITTVLLCPKCKAAKETK